MREHAKYLDLPTNFPCCKRVRIPAKIDSERATTISVEKNNFDTNQTGIKTVLKHNEDMIQQRRSSATKNLQNNDL